MKVSFIGHAAILVETRGVRILSDPWWQGPCFGTQWWIYPQPWLEPLDETKPDFIYISHGHNDHLHPGTLRRFPNTTKILVSSVINIAASLAKLGFDVVTLPPREPREIAAGVKVEITPTCSGDTLMVVSDGQETCVNLNDALHAAPANVQESIAHYLVGRYAQADYVFCGYGTASHFPNCYMIPGKDSPATASRRQAHFNGMWASIINRLQPKWAFPFAADVVILQDELLWSNEPIHNFERPVDRFRALYPTSRTEVYDLAPGFVIENGIVTREHRSEPVSNADLRETKAADILIANKTTAPMLVQIEEIATLLQQNVEICRRYLSEHKGSYRILVSLTGGSAGIEIVKVGTGMTVATVQEPIERDHYDLVFTTRFSYLRRALATAYGHEVIFVGSGGIWTYRDRAAAARDLHSELAQLLRQVKHPPASRFGDQPAWLFNVKRSIKHIMWRNSLDLYDLMTWTVFSSWENSTRISE